jgi:hypothetical protein
LDVRHRSVRFRYIPRRLRLSLKPQFRQKRSSAGIAEWQFEQVVSVGAELIGCLIFSILRHRRTTNLGLSEEYTTFSIRQMPSGGSRARKIWTLTIKPAVVGTIDAMTSSVVN